LEPLLDENFERGHLAAPYLSLRHRNTLPLLPLNIGSFRGRLWRTLLEARQEPGCFRWTLQIREENEKGGSFGVADQWSSQKTMRRLHRSEPQKKRRRKPSHREKKGGSLKEFSDWGGRGV